MITRHPDPVLLLRHRSRVFPMIYEAAVVKLQDQTIASHALTDVLELNNKLPSTRLEDANHVRATNIKCAIRTDLKVVAEVQAIYWFEIVIWSEIVILNIP